MLRKGGGKISQLKYYKLLNNSDPFTYLLLHLYNVAFRIVPPEKPAASIFRIEDVGFSETSVTT
jgi:hypothetical protein